MKKTVAICQPNFLPWLGYFEMGCRADIYVMLDDVQYIRREWVNRNKIPNQSGSGSQWLTVPLKKTKRESLINEMEIENGEEWAQKMLQAIHHIYVRTPYYKTYSGQLKETLSRKWEKLADLNLALIRVIYGILGIKDNLILSSGLKIDSKKDDKLADICERLGADIYLANNGSRPYIDPSKFHRKNIGFVFQDYEHPVYPVSRYTFMPHMSIIDLIFWSGPASLDIVMRGARKSWEDEVVYS